MPTARRMKFDALNIGLHWFVYALIVVMTVTGVLLYLGHGGWLVQVHSYTAFVGLAYIFVHVVSHYLYGGWWQIFRLFRPAKLVVTRADAPAPAPHRHDRGHRGGGGNRRRRLGRRATRWSSPA